MKVTYAAEAAEVATFTNTFFTGDASDTIEGQATHVTGEPVNLGQRWRMN